MECDRQQLEENPLMSPAPQIIALLSACPDLVTQIEAFYQSVKDKIDPADQVSIEQQITNIQSPPAE